MNAARIPTLLLLVVVLVVASGCEPKVSGDADVLARLPDRVDYNFHIKPILSDRCFTCHGPDEGAREANLRLDVEAIAKGRLESGGHAIDEGSLRGSKVYRRLTSTDPSFMMPPPESNLEISEYEKALIFKWIRQGAEYRRHWAFIPPENREAPEVAGEAWVRNDVDRFVLARLKREGLEPSPEADRERLLRRVTMDLTGLPPTLEEIDAFLEDDRPDAYERVVDRLLGSAAYAERMTSEWMDVARYADSHGYHADGLRYMWPWRDWVIRAFASNMPYDEFVTWQLAGDLLPNATRDQILATGFNRNHPMTAEGGIVDEEYRVEYVADRTNTFGRAFLGLTVECSRCHDHKYDPISQKDYYRLSAFFDNVDELGMTADDGNAGPMLALPDKATEEEIEAVRRQIAEAEADLRRRADAAGGVEIEQVAAVQTALGEPDDPVAHYPLDDLEPRDGFGISGEPELVDGPRGGRAVRFRGDFDFLSLTGAAMFERYEPFSIAVWIRPDTRDEYAEILGNAGQKNSYWRGHELYLDSLNRVSVRFIHALPHNVLHIRSKDSVATGAWTHVAFSYDGSSRAAGLRLFLDGRRVETDVLKDNLYKSILPVNARYEPEERPLRVGKSYRAFSGDDGIYSGAVDDIRIYGRALTEVEVALLAGAFGGELPAERDVRTQRLLREHALQTRDRDFRRRLTELQALRKREHELVSAVPEVMVMEEMTPPRPTYLLARGAYDAKKERVDPGTPADVLPFDAGLPADRSGLAKWLFADDHPLTARVAVNRYWAMLFGTGLVGTVDDFGSQGALPSHPELLDYLALRFRDSGWDVKALMKLIVTSATYRQSSRADEELRRRDPGNRLLARGPSYRLPFEMIRDNALAASGLLVDSVGGPSVKPYQPPGLWREKGEFSAALLNYEQDHGEKLYRRSLYTFIRRTAPPPAATAFDVPDRNFCTVGRQVTNTPMQALVLMNDPQFVEAARVLAERIQKGVRGETGDLPERVPAAGTDHDGQEYSADAVRERLTRAFRLVAGRQPDDEELDVFAAIYEEERARFAADREAALQLLGVGEYPREERLDPVETAALAVTANVMMNVDDFYMKR